MEFKKKVKNIETDDKKRNVLKEMFGSIKFKKPTEQIIKEVRKELCSRLIN